jgi:hypothetical protein
MTEQQLRKALGAVNDLEPPADDLFAQRALGRGRARAHRRRSAVLGAAAGVAVVGAIGGSWLSGAWSGGSPTPASAPERVAVSQQGADQGAPPQAPGLQSALDTGGWFSGPMTPQRTGMEALAPTLVARFPDVFAGAYAADAGNTRIVVCMTRADAALERAVAAGLPAGTVVEYRTVAHSFRELDDAANRLEAARADLQVKGVTVLGIKVEPRTNRVLVTTKGADHGVVQSLVGADLVRVLAIMPHAPATLLPSVPAPPTADR